MCTTFFFNLGANFLSGATQSVSIHVYSSCSYGNQQHHSEFSVIGCECMQIFLLFHLPTSLLLVILSCTFKDTGIARMYMCRTHSWDTYLKYSGNHGSKLSLLERFHCILHVRRISTWSRHLILIIQSTRISAGVGDHPFYVRI